MTHSPGVEGSWEGRFKLDVSKSGDNAWRVSAHVANNMSCLVEQGADGKLKRQGKHFNTFSKFCKLAPFLEEITFLL